MDSDEDEIFYDPELAMPGIRDFAEEERAQAREPGVTEAVEVERAAANPAPEYGDNNGLPPYEL